MNRNVLILGVNGQDGIMLSNILVAKDFSIFGVGKNAKPHPALNSKVRYCPIDIRDTKELLGLIYEHEIAYVYNLAGISSVAYSFKNPSETFDVNTEAVKRLLEALKNNLQKDLRFYQASSSEMFGVTNTATQDESAAFNPVSPYAESKVKTHLLCRELRNQGAFVSAGILFNHESIYRPEHFVTRKITAGLARVALGIQDKILLGNLTAERDWGFAGDYVEAMSLIMHHSRADEFVVATGKKHSIGNIVEVVIESLGIAKPISEIVQLDESLSRPQDVKCLVGNPSKSHIELGWRPKKSFEELISDMALYDFNLQKTNN
jgi:GDPmannose 4,6-dehydratase